LTSVALEVGAVVAAIDASFPVLLCVGVVARPATSSTTVGGVVASLVAATIGSTPGTVVTGEARGTGSSCLTTAEFTVVELGTVVITTTVDVVAYLRTTVGACTIAGVVTISVGSVTRTVQARIVVAVVTRSAYTAGTLTVCVVSAFETAVGTIHLLLFRTVEAAITRSVFTEVRVVNVVLAVRRAGCRSPTQSRIGNGSVTQRAAGTPVA